MTNGGGFESSRCATDFVAESLQSCEEAVALVGTVAVGALKGFMRVFYEGPKSKGS